MLVSGARVRTMIATLMSAAALHAAAAGPTSQSSDAVVSREISGKWVSSDTPPSGKLDMICATDESDWFLPAGKYQGLFEEGMWHVARGVLTISVTRSNYSSGGEGPLRRLTTPEVRTFTIESVRNGLAKVRTAKGSAWLIRCSVR
jgi:hypothetical protein